MELDNKKYTERIDSFFETPQTSKSKRLFYQWLLDGNDSEQKELALRHRFEAYDVPYNAEVEEALLQVHKEIGIAEIKIDKKRLSIGSWAMRVAAVLIPLLMVAGGIFFFLNRAPDVEFLAFHAPVQEIKQIALCCNSQIWLKDGGSLVYAKTDRGNREVNLSGRAHFVVESNAERPFLVNINNMQVAVLGTEFTIKESDNSTLITVASGAISVALANGEQLIMQPNHQLIHCHLNESSIISRLDAFDVALSSVWKKERLVFQEMPIKQMIRTVNAFYFHRVVDYSGFTELDDTRFSIQFDAGKNLETTLTLLKELTNAFNYRFEDAKVIIYN